MQPKDTEERRRAIDRVNRAYADEDYVFEDACTDARIFGHGIG